MRLPCLETKLSENPFSITVTMFCMSSNRYRMTNPSTVIFLQLREQNSDTEPKQASTEDA
jgi:hypothetical protein